MWSFAGQLICHARWRYTDKVNTFNDQELRFVRKLRTSGVDTTLELHEPCPTHSVCTPLPLFRVHRESEDTFVAEWNLYHRKGPRQLFRFDAVLPELHSPSTV